MVKVISAIIMGIGIVSGVWLLPLWAFAALVIVMTLIGAMEWVRMFLSDTIERATSVFFIFILVIVHYLSSMPCANSCKLISNTGIHSITGLLPFLFFILCMIFMYRTKQLSGVAERIGCASMGLIYLGICFPFWIHIRTLGDMGNAYVLMALIPAFLCDTVAYIFGKLIGKRKFAPMVSPNKTWAGYVGALLGAIIGVMGIRFLLLPDFSLLFSVLLILAIWIVSPLGDLIESMFKRSCNVKDSGSLIPGHGGILDRLDALIFTAPVTYYIFVWAQLVARSS